MRGRFLTVSNLLSLLRLFLAIPFIFIMLSDSPNARWWGLLLLGLAALTDKFDGVLARRYNEVTEWGKILDPLADKIGMGVVALVLVSLGQIPLWFVVAIIGRDLLILAGGIFLKRKYGIVEQSNILGKWTIGVLAVTMALAMLQVEGVLMDTALWLSVAMLVASLAMYAMSFVRIVRRTGSSSHPASGTTS